MTSTRRGWPARSPVLRPAPQSGVAACSEPHAAKNNTNGGVMETEVNEVNHTEDIVTDTPLPSYAESVIADIQSAKARVENAIEHYREQRGDEERRHAARLAEIDGHIRLLTESLGTNGTHRRAAKIDAPSGAVWGRLHAYLAEHGEGRVSAVAHALKVITPSVDSAIRSHSDVFEKTKRGGEAWVRLKK